MSYKNNTICKSIEDIVDSFLNQKINIKVENPILEGFFIIPEKKKWKYNICRLKWKKHNKMLFYK